MSFSTPPSDVKSRPTPFSLQVPDADIAAFHTLLKYSKLPPQTWEGTQAKFGVTRDWLASAKETWLDSSRFSWRDHEAHINSFPNFKLHVQDSECGSFDIHFVALFSARKDAIPIVFLHGWPGSFLEFLPMLGLLKNKYTPDTLPYHVIMPSLPGYTLSSGPPLDRDFTMEDCARVIHLLMVELGFGEKGYVAQGGDVGSMVSQLLSSTEDACKAFHLNMLIGDEPSPSDLTPAEEVHQQRTLAFRASGSGYLLEHGTRPATISSVLSASPLALLAWIGEKMIQWADEREPIPLEEILRNVTLWWFTESFPRSIYPYRFVVNPKPIETTKTKPFGYSYFPAEVGMLPEAQGKKVYPNLIRYSHETGGHFAALEQPKALLADVEDFATKLKEKGIF